MALIATDLPEPVVPAINRCGMRERSATTDCAADVLAERECQGRTKLVIYRRFQYLAQRY